MTTTHVIDVPSRSRYEAVQDGTVVGFAAYQRPPELVVFTHTEVDPEHERQGVGGILVQGALDHVRSPRLQVLPICPFVHAWMLRHPASAGLDYRQSSGAAD